MPQRALAPSLSELSRAKVLPPEPDDWDRLLQIQRAQNATNDPYDKTIGGVLGFLEGLNPFGREPESVKSLRTSRDTGNFLGQMASNFPAAELKGLGGGLAVAFGAGKPDAIKMLKRRGAKQIESILESGLERRVRGIPPPIAQTKEVPEEMLHALSIAQQRWPRLFGHLNDVADVDSMTRLRNKNRITRGEFFPGPVSQPKLGKLGIDPEHAIPDTVGHELLHSKDALLNPNFYDDYKKANIRFGYKDNPYEMRARAMGARFKDIYDTVMAQGGRARDAQGRNIRVPKR